MRYTPDLREKAFALYCQNKTLREIRHELEVGDTSGISRIAREDNWLVKKRIWQLNQTIDTVRDLSQDEVKRLGPGPGPVDQSGDNHIQSDVNFQSGYEQLVKKRAEIVFTARTVSEAARKVIEQQVFKFRSLREAWDVYREAIQLEQKIAGANVEEMFILRVFEAMREEIQDQSLLSRIGDRLRLIVAEEKISSN